MMTAPISSLPPSHLLGVLSRSSGIQQLAPVNSARDSGVVPADGAALARFDADPVGRRLRRLQEGLLNALPSLATADDPYASLSEAWAPIYLEMTILMRACFAEFLPVDVGERAELATLIREWRRRFDAQAESHVNESRRPNLELVRLISSQLHHYYGMKMSGGVLARFRPSLYEAVSIYLSLSQMNRGALPVLETVGACFEGALYLEKALDALESPDYGRASQPPSSSNF